MGTFEVKTEYSDRQIKQSIVARDKDTFMQIYEQIIDLQESGTRRALIEMGWKPPEK